MKDLSSYLEKFGVEGVFSFQLSTVVGRLHPARKYNLIRDNKIIYIDFKSYNFQFTKNWMLILPKLNNAHYDFPKAVFIPLSLIFILDLNILEIL